MHTYETIQTYVGAVHTLNICVAVCCCRSIPYIHDMTHSYVGHDPFIYVTWLICTYETIQSYVGAVHTPNICVPVCCCRSIPYIHDMTHSYVSHYVFICACLHTHTHTHAHTHTHTHTHTRTHTTLRNFLPYTVIGSPPLMTRLLSSKISQKSALQSFYTGDLAASGLLRIPTS